MRTPVTSLGRRLAVVGALLIAAPGLAQPPGSARAPARDYPACAAAMADGWTPPQAPELAVRAQGRVSGVPANPYVAPRALTTAELDAMIDLAQEIVDARAGVDTYLDQTLAREVDVDTVRSMVARIMTSVLRMRCLDRDRGARVERDVSGWVAAVERELRADELEQKCVAQCETAKARCLPTDCVVNRN